MSPAFYKEVKRKTELLRADYGGMMTVKDIMRELGIGSHHTVNNWLRENDVEGVKVDRKSVKYETDLIARRIVEQRGMV